MTDLTEESLMEQIIIRGTPVEVPAEVVSAGRAAVQAWHEQQLTRASDAPQASVASPTSNEE